MLLDSDGWWWVTPWIWIAGWWGFAGKSWSSSQWAVIKPSSSKGWQARFTERAGLFHLNRIVCHFVLTLSPKKMSSSFWIVYDDFGHLHSTASSWCSFTVSKKIPLSDFTKIKFLLFQTYFTHIDANRKYRYFLMYWLWIPMTNFLLLLWLAVESRWEKIMDFKRKKTS